MIIIGQVSGKELFETHFEIAFDKDQEFTPAYFVDRKNEAWVILSLKNKSFLQIQYGMIPFWSTQRILHFESPVEGSENSGNERIKKKIILHPSYRRPIRETRCLIPVDYFILINELKEPYLFFSTESRPFAIAGLFDTWKEHPLDTTFYQGFSILTLPASEIVSKMGISKFPLILPVKSYKRWLKPDAHLSEITALLTPYDDSLVNGYPISKNHFFRKINSKELLKPVGDFIRINNNQDPYEIANFLRSFRYKRGLTHPKNDQTQRVWRGKSSE